jgi:ABC-type branched-subunit amino acid transport system substrate-binding protein
MRISRATALLTCTATLFIITACGQPATQTPSSKYVGAYLYGADANMSNPFGAAFEKTPGVLLGMKGTRPAIALSEDFQARLKAEDPSIIDFNYAGEAYDAVMIASLATQIAGTTDPNVVKQYINGVTIGPDSCHTIADCMKLAKDGRDIAYRGITVRSGFTDSGEPSTTSYGTFHFGPTNQLDAGKTEYLRAGNEASASTAAQPRPAAQAGKNNGAPLVIGALLAISNTVNKARFAAARMAVKEVNAAGGVLGVPVVWKDGDDGAKNDVALAQINAHKAAGVHVLIGTSGSGVTTAILPEIVKRQMIMISPSNTAAALSKVDDQGFFFRTAPSDVLQARALADMIMRDGVRKVTLIGRKDAYGEGLIEGVKKELMAAGMAEVNIQSLTFEVDGTKVKDVAAVASVAQQTHGFTPDGVLVVGNIESAEVVKALVEAKLEIRH